MGRLEQKEIRYSGYSTLPDDYQCKDGAIAFATNATFEDGGLKRIPEALPIALLVAQGAEVYIHHTANYYHYIIVYSFTDEEGSAFVRLYVVDREVMERYLNTANAEGAVVTFVDAMYHCTGSTFDEDTDPEHNKPLNMSAGVVDFLYRCAGAFVSLVAVGNTLIVSTEAAMYYFLCKSGGLTEDDEQEALTEYCSHPYIFLGNKVPSVAVAFGLELECVMSTIPNTGVTKLIGDKDDFDDSETASILASCAHTIAATTFCCARGSTQNDTHFAFPTNTTIEARGKYAVHFYADINDDCDIVTFRLFGHNIETDNYERVQYTSVRGDFDDKGYTFHPFTPLYSYDRLDILPFQDGSEQIGFSAAEGTVFIDKFPDNFFNDNYYIIATQENYDAVMGAINKFVAEQATGKNRFIHPFFVRYAVRLYDGSVCELSVPILMCPNSGYVPLVWCNNFPKDNKESKCVFYDSLYLYAYVAALRYKMVNDIATGWKDIIAGIDVYVSPPIYPYSQDKAFSYEENIFSYKDYIHYDLSNNDVTVNEIEDMGLYGIGRLTDTQDTDAISGPHVYKKLSLYHDICSLYNFGGSNLEETRLSELLRVAPYRITQVAAKTDAEIDEDIKAESRFYLIKKLSLDDLSVGSSFVAIGMEDGTLEGLAGREALSEDVVNYAAFVGTGLFSYNQRLHVWGGNAVYRDFTAPASQVQYDESDNKGTLSAAWVYIRTDDGAKCVRTVYDDSTYRGAGFVWLFYPNNRAYKVLLQYGECWLSLPLHEHDFLNGAYFFARVAEGLADLVEEYAVAAPSADGTGTIANTNIYVSEVDNPFVFRNSTTVTVGSGRVLALSTAAQAMSQGQFGQYPLYAFTDEGVWSLSVNSDGTYGTSQPLSRDVVTNVASVTQLDSSVLFVTDRGIMEVYGSTVSCVSDGIDGEWGEFNPLSLPYFLDLYMQYIEGVLPSDEGYADKAAAVEAMLTAWAGRRFCEFIQSCRVVYDYTHQRIIVYNDDSRLAYVLSLQSKEWGLLFTDLRRTVNSYPDALALRTVVDGEYAGVPSDDGEEHWCLENLSVYRSAAAGVSGDDDVSTELFVSRPFKLDAPDVYKTVESVVQRGYFQQSMQENHIVGVVLYGSGDLFNWYMVAQSATVSLSDAGLLSAGHIIDKVQGDPYKYYRVVVVTRLSARESVCGCSVLYELKDNNILR